MSERYIERGESSDSSKPISPRQEIVYRRIRNVLAKYMVRGDSKNLDAAALEIWRATRR